MPGLLFSASKVAPACSRACLRAANSPAATALGQGAMSFLPVSLASLVFSSSGDTRACGVPSGSTHWGQGTTRGLSGRQRNPFSCCPPHLGRSASAPLITPCPRPGCLSAVLSSELFFFSLSQPDLLNFKKGWLTKQYEDGQVSAQDCCAPGGPGSRCEVLPHPQLHHAPCLLDQSCGHEPHLLREGETSSCPTPVLSGGGQWRGTS